MKKIIKLLGKSILFIALIATIIFFAYCNNTALANQPVRNHYYSLKQALKEHGYSDALLVVSTRRVKWHNAMLTKFNGAANKSRHLSNDAIDFLVFDVNNDGKCNAGDVEIVFKILEEEIIKDAGGIGTYLHSSKFYNR